MSNTGSLRTTATWTESLRDLANEFRKWGKKDYVLPTLADARRLGKVRVTFAVNGQWRLLECSIGSSWSAPYSPEVSIRAILIAIEGARKADQRGIGALLAAATQHLAFPSGQDDPYKVLGVAPNATKEAIRHAYTILAQQHHPDHGGNEQEFKRVQKAAEKLGVA